MNAPRIELVVLGEVVLAATPAGLETAEAIGIAGGRVVASGAASDVLRAAGPGARVERFPGAAIVPGLHDFHLHLVGMARARREARLDGLAGDALLGAVHDAAAALPAGEWLRGRGWTEEAIAGDVLGRLAVLLADRPALVYSHDSHSAWASPPALAAARITTADADPPGGRIERDRSGRLTGVLRETATDLVEAVAGRLGGTALGPALDETLAELAAWGITAATDAGDTTAENGSGRWAALGDRASRLLAAAPTVDGRIRLAVGVPAEAIEAAAELGLATGAPIGEASTVRAGWAKAYADGALGSRTAALFEPYTCPPHDTGILRLEPEALDDLLARGRRSGIGLAVHAIGDRAAAAVLDAIDRASPAGHGLPPHRIEHLQLLRAEDRPRLARLDVTASIQPVHCAADRPHVDRCWRDRAALAYPWRSLADAGVRLAFGSDAPIETANPWHGMFAAVHRRLPGDHTRDWRPGEALSPAAALAGYTSGPAAAGAHRDEGHLHPGAVADLAVLNVDLEALQAADERLGAAKSVLTLVGGIEVHRA
ncbi:MAG TPA: amidohydrolase [Candidatus Limnocylindria bacterium]